MLTKHPSHSRPTASSVRVIGGSLRGSKLPVPNLPGLRPTPDRVRETLFNWLRPMLPGAHVLDLFAGTGVLGIEALSSGARAVEFVEMHSSAAQSLREQLQRLKIADRAQLRQASALDALPQLCGGYDVVFLDPPYALDLWSTCLEQIVTRRLLAPTGLVYVEWPEACSFGVPAALQWRKREQAGSVGFGLLEYGANSR